MAYVLKACSCHPLMHAALVWFAMAWNLWQWTNTRRDSDHSVPRTLFIRFIEWTWFNSEIFTSRKYIPCQNIPYPVEYEQAIIINDKLSWRFTNCSKRDLSFTFSVGFVFVYLCVYLFFAFCFCLFVFKYFSLFFSFKVCK